jgi:putative CocE/NonD family hydrolase
MVTRTDFAETAGKEHNTKPPSLWRCLAVLAAVYFVQLAVVCAAQPSSANDTDWWIKLVDAADGKACVLDPGVVRARYRHSRTRPEPLTPGKIERGEIHLWATPNVFKKGHRIREEVASGSFPAADRNPNAFIDLSRATERDFVVASQAVYHDAKRPSYVELPLIAHTRKREWIEPPLFPNRLREIDGDI